MLYAKIVSGLAVSGAFDYIVPEALAKRINVGSRVRVNFRNREITGYVVELAAKTRIKNLKTISELIDNFPVLDKNMLLLTRDICDYYCCSWGEAIETALPLPLRKGRRILDIEQQRKPFAAEDKAQAMLLHDLDGKAKWDIYFSGIKKAVDSGKSAIILLPDVEAVFKARQRICNLGVSAGILYRGQRNEFEEWINVKKGVYSVVLATRSGIFAPLNNLGLIIIDEEQDCVYKQDQVPHYNAREVAFMRIAIEKAVLILGTSCASMEGFYLAKKEKIEYTFIPRGRAMPEVKIIDTRRMHFNAKQKNVFTKYLEDSIASTLESKGKALLFLNRRGFATYASCSNCGTLLKCPRCSINLAYHFKEEVLNCHYCNFKMPVQKICPNCNAGYIRYQGIGTEKIESELSRLFPQAKVRLLDKNKDIDAKETGIFVSTESIIKEGEHNFDFIGILSIDNFLNRIDFRSSEKAFSILTGLLHLAGKKIVIQTAMPSHHIFRSIQSGDVKVFYEEELKQRKQLKFPPYRHMGLVKLRGTKEGKVAEASESLFNLLVKLNKDKNTEIICAAAGSPAKLRDNYCRQILIKTDSCARLCRFLKMCLKDFRHSGIIVTVDMDPV